MEGKTLLQLRFQGHGLTWNVFWKNSQLNKQFENSITEFSVSVLTMLVGRQEGHLACRKLGIGLLVVMI